VCADLYIQLNRSKNGMGLTWKPVWYHEVSRKGPRALNQGKCICCHAETLRISLSASPLERLSHPPGSCMTPDPITWKEANVMTLKDAKTRREAPLDTPTDLTSNATRDISGALTILLAELFALYVKTKKFHWHMSGPHFRDYHLLLDPQGEQIFTTTDAIAEHVRKIGGTTLRSIGKKPALPCLSLALCQEVASRRSDSRLMQKA